MRYSRRLNLRSALKTKSHFLFGARATGKSWLIAQQLPDVPLFDLLDDDVYSRLLRRPRQLGEEAQGQSLVVIDEIQKLPTLLDEVHRLISKEGMRFLLTGSSARKLRHGGANLLAGRARSLHLFPLTFAEIPDFDLERYVQIGGMPAIYTSSEPKLDLKAYVNTYLKEEIQAEAIVRRIDHFARFMDVIGLSSGKEINIASIGQDAGVPPRTVAGFIEVLKDTLLAFELQPFQKAKKRKCSSKTKLYLFDVGVANHLAARLEIAPKSEAFGEAFEHFIIQDIRAQLAYADSDEQLFYWRAKTFEVDLIIGNRLAVEIKSTEQVQEKHLAGLKALAEEKALQRYAIVSRDPVKRMIGNIEVWPWREFLDKGIQT